MPESARPSIPSCPAIAAAVVTWSPVIIRARIPASLQRAIASFASLRGGSTIATRASSVRSFTCARRSPPASNEAGSKSFEATASTRSPSLASRSFSAVTRSMPSAAGTVVPSGPRICDERASRTSGAPFTKQRTTLRPSSSSSWNVAMNLYSESNGTSATRGNSRRVSSTSIPPFAASTTRAASVGSPTISPSWTAASLASAIGIRNGSSFVSDSPQVRRILPVVE